MKSQDSNGTTGRDSREGAEPDPRAAELRALRELAESLGVLTHYTDGLQRPVVVSPETLVRVCAALGAPVTGPHDAADAQRAIAAPLSDGSSLSPVLVAWNGVLAPNTLPDSDARTATLVLEDGARLTGPVFPALPPGFHRLTLEIPGGSRQATVISAPTHSWRRSGKRRSWGVGTHLAALRTSRSRSVGDLADLRAVCRWIHGHGGDLVTTLPLLPTFNDGDPEPSPYSPVSRLFWSELVLDLGDAHRPAPPSPRLDVGQASAEVRTALRDVVLPEDALSDVELVRYARFRGAQARLGRNWRDWPVPARSGVLRPDHVDPVEERFHLTAQWLLRGQLNDLRHRLENDGVRLGLDLAVGVHSDGYDPWSRQSLFGNGMSVGAPPDFGFPSGQDWGFSPLLPAASRLEGHRYLASSIGHQAAVAGLLRIDHIMAWTRLYWIPHGMGLHEGTYVGYPAEELFAVLSLESHRHRCEIIGENLGTVPPEILEALPRHGIRGMYLAQFEAAKGLDMEPPTEADVALIGTHDTPTFAGWMHGADIADRVRNGLLGAGDEPRVRDERAVAVAGLARRLGREATRENELLGALLAWLGGSESTLVIPWIEDLWLEERGVNLPGTRSSEHPNWQRPMSRVLDDIMADPAVAAMIRRLDDARRSRTGALSEP
jgi:4-alpha-glucanotransferase